MSNPLTALSDAIVALYDGANVFQILGISLLLFIFFGVIGYVIFIPKIIKSPNGRVSIFKAILAELVDLGIWIYYKLLGTSIKTILISIIPVIIILFFVGIIYGSPFAISSAGEDFFLAIQNGISTIFEF